MVAPRSSYRLVEYTPTRAHSHRDVQQIKGVTRSNWSRVLLLTLTTTCPINIIIDAKKDRQACHESITASYGHALVRAQ